LLAGLKQMDIIMAKILMFTLLSRLSATGALVAFFVTGAPTAGHASTQKPKQEVLSPQEVFNHTSRPYS